MGEIHCSLFIACSVDAAPHPSPLTSGEGWGEGGHSDDFEIAIQLPVADMPTVLALFPFTAGSKVLDEGIAEQFPRRRGALQALRRVPQGTRQGQVFRVFLRIGIAH